MKENNSGDNVYEEKENETDIRKEKKRKSSDGDQMPRKKKRKGIKDTKENFDEDANLFVETDKCNHDLKVIIKEEHSEIETAGIELGVGIDPSGSTKMRTNILSKKNENESRK